jgi:ribonuclease D
MQIEQVTSAEALGPLLDAARAEGRCAIDTEFVWERTYAPGLCLVQIATAERLAVVDPVEGAPLEPVAELMADPAVEKVMHAPSGDLAAFVLHHDVRPQHVYDTQLAAGFAGYGGTLSLERLLEAAVRVRLRHDEGFTDWQRRPLTPTQVEYAADDVRYLLGAADALRKRLGSQGREAWVAEELGARYGPDAALVQDPDTAWRRVAGRGKVRSEGLAALRAAAAWREREARRRNLPAAWLVKDATLVELARRRPATPNDAENVRGLQIRRGRQLDELLATLADPGPPPEADAELPGDVRRRIRVVLPLASAVLQARCAAAGVASELVATRADLESFIAGQAVDSDRPHPLLTGWRRELAGESLLRLLRGEISLRVLPGPPHVAES